MPRKTEVQESTRPKSQKRPLGNRNTGASKERKWGQAAEILKFIRDGFFVLDRRMVFTQFNAAAERLLGRKRRGVIGRTFRSAFPEAGGSIFEKKYSQALRTKKSVHFETHFGIPPYANWYEVDVYPRNDGIAVFFQVVSIRKETEIQLKNQVNFIQTLMDAIPNPIFYKDEKGTYIGCNAAYEKYLGRSRARIVGKTVFDVVSKEFADVYHRQDLDLFLHPGVQIYESKVTDADGSAHDVVFSKATFNRADGKVGGLVGVIADITERKRAEEEIRQLKEFNESIVQNMAEGVVITDANGRLTFSNPMAATLLGYSQAELLGQNWTTIVPPDHQEIVRSADRRRKEGRTDRYELTLLHRNGERVPVLVAGSPRFDMGKVVGSTAVFSDISIRYKLEAELRALSLTDMATGLYNRRGFFTLAEQQLKLARRLDRPTLIVFFDLDNLKKVNDTFGHHEGDRALVDTAEILKRTFRDSDIAGRLGGDEFAVFAMGSRDSDPDALLERFQSQIGLFNQKRERPFHLSLSVGTLWVEASSSLSLEEMVREADKRMYEKKREKR
jgi:diguanylate cyclase (GGDEF)-like protein/PAS domain S-box-containing protein